MHKTFIGTVVSVKMKDTIIVEVVRKKPHPMYRKLLKRSKRFKVAVNNQDVVLGDSVTIEETRPVAKGKYFQIKNIKTVGKIKERKEKTDVTT